MTNPALTTMTDDYPTGLFTSVLTGREAFLADHVIQGKKILPGVAYLEMARAAVAFSATVDSGHTMVLSDSVFVRPLIVDRECAVETKVYPGAVGEFGVEVLTDQGVHFHCSVSIRDERARGGDTSSGRRLDVPALENRCTDSVLAREQVYADFRRLGLGYGPSHQGIEKLRFGPDCALAQLFLPGASGQGMDLNPGLLDSVMQAAALLAGRDDVIRVPFAIKNTEIHGLLTDRAHAYLAKTDRGIDCTIVDDEGAVKVVITGFVNRELDLDPKQDEVVFCRPEWREEPAPVDDAQDGNDAIVVSGQETYGDLVKAVITAAQELIRKDTARHVLEVRLPEDRPSWLGIVALLKTVHLECSRVRYRLKAGDKYVQLGCRAGDGDAVPAYRWPDDRTVLLTGGLGGVGTLIAQDIARISKGCTLILVGRGELDAPKSDVVRDLEASGAKVVYARCDVTHRTEVAALIAEHPQISGVIHGAGVIKDCLIGDKTPDAVDQVLAPKVQGLENLDEATAGLTLDYFVTLSSVAGVMGNAGQADYAAANGYMDAYMRHRAQQVEKGQRHGKSLSINWPLWESGGMQVDEATKQNLLHVLKIKPLPAASGRLALRQILAGPPQQRLVLFGNKNAVSTMLDKTQAAADGKRPKSLRVETSRLAREILQEVKIRTTEHLSLRLPPAQLDEEADWAEFGFDSILLSGFVTKLNAEFHLDLMPTALFEATNMLRFSQYLAENYSQQMAMALSLGTEEDADTTVVTPEPESPQIRTFARGFRRAYDARVAYRETDIAIVGMSCRVAGARTLDEFWRVLIDEKDMITEIPRERWDFRAYPDSARWGSFIDGVDEFDSLFFGISPAEAAYMAPEQRLMMQYVWECLENAGCGDAIRGTNTGIFVGCGLSGYSLLLSKMPIEAYSSTGAIPSVGPNRISYLLDWHGPSEPIETACSSSLVAVHRAVEAIRSGHCDQAITGGVNLLLTPEAYVSFTKAGMLCDDGRCKTFSDKANGYVRGEGIGMIMLKPLRAALEEGYVVHAVIKGTAENHGGRTNSLTAPNPKSQTAVVMKAMRDAEVDFSRISYIECHGTGTDLGDPVEIEGLKAAAAQLLEGRGHEQTCRLGSVKSNIGHLELAAGIIGLIKVVLQMQHGKIARSLHCDTINPYIDLAGTPFVVAQTASEWEVGPGQTRVAGVSSFGFGGVNSHVVLEEFREPPEDDVEVGVGQAPQLMVISARNEESLLNYVARYPDYVKTLSRSPATFKRLAYTLQLGRSEMQERVVFIAKSLDDWAEQLDTFIRNGGKVYDRSIHRGTVTSANSLDVGDTRAGREYIRQLMNSSEYGKLADLWIKGTKIDWNALHA